MSKHKVLIVGGGFGGVKAALDLSKHDEVSVTLLSERPDFRYYPTMYHTATGGLKSQSSIPLVSLTENMENVQLAQGKAVKLNRASKTIITEDGQRFGYDTLVLALGVVTNYFGIEGLADYSYGIKSMEEIQEFKAQLHKQLTDERKPDLNYVVVGGGPTGIELAGALPEYLRRIMTNHGIKHRAIHVDLIEAAPRLLPRSPKHVSRAIKRRLQHLGVSIYTGKQVQGETADALMVSGKPIGSHTVVWTAGMANNPFYKANGFALNERGKVMIDEHMQTEPHLYVIGDNAGTPFSGMAQTALLDGAYVATAIVRSLEGKKVHRYKAKQPISVIPVGAYWASVEWGKFTFSGRRGWLLRQAADWIGFNDIQPWWDATEQWITEFGTQEDCPTCATAQAS